MADIQSYYAYDPNHVVPCIFTALVGTSLIIHTWQNFHYQFWKVMFFLCWGGAVYTSGWATRIVSSYHVANQNWYIAQYVLIIAGPPIYSAAEYNVLGRLLAYLPMHTPVHPRRIMYFFIYLGVLVESLTAAGGSRMATAGDDTERLKSGATLVAAASLLQICVESFFIFMVAMLHRRVVRSNMLTKEIRTVCIMLYGTSTLIILRSIYRSVEKFSILNTVSSEACEGTCKGVLRHEWYLFVFEATPMVLYTFWLNIVNPGRYLPRNPNIYLDFERIERNGPGWTDGRSRLQTFMDPFDWVGFVTKKVNHEKYWENPEEYEIVEKTGHANTRSLKNMTTVSA